MRAGSASASSSAAAVSVSLRSAVRSRISDYVELTRPRIAVMSLATVTVGYALASADLWRVEGLLHALLGIGLVAVASSAWNQLIERKTDARMRRTETRPLPAGRLMPREVAAFGLATGTAGGFYLFLTVGPLTAGLAVFVLLLYVVGYTPLKRRSSLCTAVGAIPGALPPVLGWTAAGGSLDAGAFALFAVMFVWQFPHFLAIAWLYRRDYENAGLRMLPVASRHRHATGLIAALYALALLPVSLLPSELAVGESLAGDLYTWAALLLGMGYAVIALRFAARETTRTARGLLWVSLVYLPLLLLVLTFDHFRLLQ
ncbi:MAG: heme o synthase [Planctomycetaceae bacterium]